MFKKITLLSIATSLALANSFSVNEEKYELDNISVTSSSLGTNNIDYVDISEKASGNIRNALRQIPGIYMGGTSNLNQKIHIRGLNEKAINITIDGARQMGNIFHHSANLIIDADMIKAVDVGTGVLSVVNNSGSLGGSVAFSTIDAIDLLQDGNLVGGKVKTSYATNNKEWQNSLALAGAHHGFSILAYAKHNSYEFGKSANNQRIGGTDGKDTNVLIKLAYEKDEHKVKLSYENTDYKGRYPLKGEFGITDNTAILSQSTPRKTLIFNYAYNPSDIIDFNLKFYNTKHTLSHQFTKEDILLANLSKPNTIKDSNVNTFGFYINNKTILGNDEINNTLRYGVEYYKTTGYNSNIKQFSIDNSKQNVSFTPMPNSPKDKTSNFSAYLEDRIKINNFYITPGLRVDKYTLDNSGAKKQSFNNISPALALEYDFTNGLNVFAGYQKAFRGPAPVEVFKVSQIVTSVISDDLKPETGSLYEGGLSYNYENDDLNIQAIAKYFYADYKNLIKELASTDKTTTYVRKNTGGAKISGMELFAKLAYKDFSASFSYTKQDTKYKDGFKTSSKNGSTSLAKGDVLAYTDMGDKYTLNLEYNFANLDTILGYNLLAFSSKTLEDKSKRAGFGVSDVYLAYYPSYVKNLELNLSVNNIFNKLYVSHTTRGANMGANTDYEAGRNIRFGFAYSF